VDRSDMEQRGTADIVREFADRDFGENDAGDLGP
jgi:hypothetical protein